MSKPAEYWSTFQMSKPAECWPTFQPKFITTGKVVVFQYSTNCGVVVSKGDNYGKHLSGTDFTVWTELPGGFELSND